MLRESHGLRLPSCTGINSQAAQLETALAERSIPYLVKGSERFYDRGEVRRSLDALARLAADEPGADPYGLLIGYSQLKVGRLSHPREKVMSGNGGNRCKLCTT